MKNLLRRAIVAGLLGGAGLVPVHAANLSCDMRFKMTGWSVIYKTASGRGTVICSNGQKLHVRLESQGGGLTVGKSRITNGHGEFTGVGDIGDVLGDYVAGSAEAAAVKGGEGTAVSKGPVNLVLGGTGDGWDIGVAFSKFSIKPR